MSYWYTFENNVFKIEPPATGEVKTRWLEDSDERIGYWVISEDGNYINQEEHCGGNNCDFEEELQVICDELKQAGYSVNGISAFNILWSCCGVVAIKDNIVSVNYEDVRTILLGVYNKRKVE